MAFYHQFKYAEIVKPSNPYFLNRGFPISRFRLSHTDKIKNVELVLSESPLITRWFTRSEVRLYKGKSQLITIENCSTADFKKLTANLSGVNKL